MTGLLLLYRIRLFLIFKILSGFGIQSLIIDQNLAENVLPVADLLVQLLEFSLIAAFCLFSLYDRNIIVLNDVQRRIRLSFLALLKFSAGLSHPNILSRCIFSNL